MDIHKAGAWANIGNFCVGCIVVYLTWKSLHPAPTAGSPSVDLAGSMPLAAWIFLVGLVGAGVLHFAAAIIQGRGSKKSNRQIEEPTSQAKTDTSSNVSGAHPQERIWVSANITPLYLQGLRDGRTAREAQKIEADFLGKWMKLSGVVMDVHEHTTPAHVTVVDIQQPGIRWPVSLEFDEKWHGYTTVLRIGDTINVLGQIDEVGTLGLQLHNCEIIQS